MSGLEKETYYKNGDGFVLNIYYKDGEPVELFEKQAKYQLAPLGTELRLKKEAPASPQDKPVKESAVSSKEARK